jgi:hypothetical protein
LSEGAVVRRLLLLLVFALVLAGGAVVTWKAMGQAKLVQDDLTTARALLARAGGFQSGELDQRLRLIDQAGAHTTSAQQRLQRWPPRQLGILPRVGRDVRVAQAVAASATRTARSTREVVAALQPVQTKPPTQASVRRAADALLALHGTLNGRPYAKMDNRPVALSVVSKGKGFTGEATIPNGTAPASTSSIPAATAGPRGTPS